MDPNEMKSLETKTREIVETLSNLQRETGRQKRMGDQLEEGKNAILQLASELAQTTIRLADVLELLHHSSLAGDVERLESKIDEVKNLTDIASADVRMAEELCRSTAELATTARESMEEVSAKLLGVESTCTEVLRCVELLGRESESRDADIANRLRNLESVIGRIDRNTQKGFGKERG